MQERPTRLPLDNLDLLVEQGQEPADDNGAKEAIRVCTCIDLANAMLHLDADDRQVLHLRFWDDLSWGEIAERLGIGLGPEAENRARYVGKAAVNRLRKILMEKTK